LKSNANRPSVSLVPLFALGFLLSASKPIAVNRVYFGWGCAGISPFGNKREEKVI
jgi:hypothetical protein